MHLTFYVLKYLTLDWTGPAIDHSRLAVWGSFLQTMFYKHKSEEVFTIATEKMDLLWFKHYCLSFWYHQMGEENFSSLSVLVNKGTVQPFGQQGVSI